MRKILLAACLVAFTGAPAFADAPQLSSDKPSYRVGDTAVFTVTAQSDCFLTLVAIGADGEAGVLLPNRFQADSRIPAATPVAIPGPKSPFSYRIRRCGDERVFAICSAQERAIGGVSQLEIDIDQFLHWVSENEQDVAKITFPVLEPLRPPSQ